MALHGHKYLLLELSGHFDRQQHLLLVMIIYLHSQLALMVGTSCQLSWPGLLWFNKEQ